MYALFFNQRRTNKIYNGNLQTNSGLNFNTMNNTDWTCEIWIYMKANETSAIFDYYKKI